MAGLLSESIQVKAGKPKINGIDPSKQRNSMENSTMLRKSKVINPS